MNETAVCLCDVGLMINDYEINSLAMFCLNQMSEMHETHEYIKRSNLKNLINEKEQPSVIFDRINFLLENMLRKH
jgi:uncharacterized protein YqfB (UPF0267 family)